jgi:hypothetical protein
MDAYAERLCEATGKPLPGQLIHATVVALASINHSRWVVQCPFCPGAELADPADPRFYCFSCANAAVGNMWVGVAFPKDAPAIETALVARPLPENRNWEPSEKVVDLLAENQRMGID